MYEILTAEGQFISRHVDGLKRFVGNVGKYQRFEEDQEWTKVKMKQPANLPTDNTTNNSAVVEIEESVAIPNHKPQEQFYKEEHNPAEQGQEAPQQLQEIPRRTKRSCGPPRRYMFEQ